MSVAEVHGEGSMSKEIKKKPPREPDPCPPPKGFRIREAKTAIEVWADSQALTADLWRRVLDTLDALEEGAS